MTSNREGGKGRDDIRIAPLHGKGRGFLLDEYAQKNLSQIIKKDDARGMKASQIISIGISVCGRSVGTVHTVLITPL